MPVARAVSALSDGTLQIVAAGPWSDKHRMKIATFNINNIKRRLPNLLDWLKAAKPDVVCLQELKCSERDFPADPIRKPAIRQFGAERGPGTASRSWRVTANPC
jgi:hypothetical protein